ncbi:MAG: ABC transporter substrate-binding protein [Oscillospiraceae bacterium]|nr:ABC transporter substrate-binding protein [Oscillospiraceae bacterium]
MKKKWIAPAAAALLLLSGCSVENMMADDLLMAVQNQDTAATSQYEYQEVTGLKVPVGEETLNPYQMTTDTSLRAATLLYDSLTKLNPNYSYDLCLASSVELQGTSCVVTLRKDVRFSDGTALTAADVQYSYRQAVGTQNQYTALFSNVTGVSVLSDDQIRFTLGEADVLFPNLLTFPVLKNGSAAEPLGSGRYRLAGENRLEPNPYWYGGDTGKIQTIELVQQPDWETSFYSMKTGSLDYLFVDADETVAETGGSIYYVPMPNLIYIGINDSRARFSDVRFRQMLAATVDRGGLLENSYYDRAQETAVPFPAAWGQLAALEMPQSQDFERVQALLAELGLDNRDDEGYIIMGTRRVSVDILVNAENETKMQIAEALRETLRSVGLDATVTGVGFSEYQTRVAERQYDLYIGEVKLKNNLDLTSLFTVQTQQTSAENLQALEVYHQWRQGTATAQSFLEAFQAAVPLIPVGTRNGAIYYNRNIYYELRATAQDLFYNIQDW